MTREEALQFVLIASKPRLKPVVEWATLQEDTDGSWSVVIEPVYGDRQVHSDAEQANWGLAHLLAEHSSENDRFFTLSSGVPRACDREAWFKDSPNREKTRISIACSPYIEAQIIFSGRAWALVDLDEEVRLWVAQFRKIAQNEYFGGTAFKTADRAEAFVYRFIELGCPSLPSPGWVQLMTEFQSG
jgi:hypothetical protein